MRTMMITAVLFILALSAAQAAPTIEGCPVFPVDNHWNLDISDAPVHPRSSAYIANINANGGDFLHPDFGEDPTYGIPWTTVPGTQPKVPVTFLYDDESDPGPYPIPPNPPIEAGSDRHIILIDRDNCVLYELFAAEQDPGTLEWSAGSGAIFDLDSNALRPEGWTSADAAGLPIYPGLAKCDEANSGVIDHALRFTVSRTQRAYIYPARHFASSLTDADYPPMGLRLRLKANYDLSGFTGQALAIAQALKTYGMILADNGSNWFISGETNPTCWDDDNLNTLKSIAGTAFEVIVSPPPADVVPLLDTDQSGVLAWGPVTWAEGYTVQISTNRAFRGAQTHTLGVVDSFTLPALSRGLYYWRVCARRGDGPCGAWSITSSFVVGS